MAGVTVTLLAQGWQLDITTPGMHPTISSDRGELNVTFTTPAPGQVNILAESDIQLPAAAGGGLGEQIVLDLTVDNAAGLVTGTIVGKGMGKGRKGKGKGDDSDDDFIFGDDADGKGKGRDGPYGGGKDGGKGGGKGGGKDGGKGEYALLEELFGAR